MNTATVAPAIPGEFAGDPPAWAAERARSIIGTGETILAVYAVSDKNRANAAAQPFALYYFCPLVWPMTILTSPCICAKICAKREILKSTVYIVTDRRVYRSIDATNVTPGVLGTESGDVPLADISGISLDAPLGMCYSCVPVEQLMLSLPVGHVLNDFGGGGSHPQMRPHTMMRMFVDNPLTVAQLLRNAKDAAAGVAPTAMHS